MIIEYELQGSQLLHKGIFDTRGFWARFETEYCDITKEALSYKIYSHFSFTFEHKDKKIANQVFAGLCDAISEDREFILVGVGFISRLD